MIWTFCYIENDTLKVVIILGCLVNFFLDTYRIGPYLGIFKTDSDQSTSTEKPHLKILSSNVFVNNKSYKKLLSLVGEIRPDIILLLEPDDKWAKEVESLKDTYQYSKVLPKENTYGMILYSKFKLIDLKVKYLVDEKVPSIFSNIVLPEFGIVEIICVHPRPPRPHESSSLQRDAELISIAKYVKSNKDKRPILVFGDLNDVAWSHSTRLFKRISGMLDPRIGRGFYNTFPVKWRCLRVPLDHIFHTPNLKVREISVLKSIGSDHFPITASFDLVNNKFDPHQAEKSDSEDINESNQTMQEAKEYNGPKMEVDKDDE